MKTSFYYHLPSFKDKEAGKLRRVKKLSQVLLTYKTVELELSFRLFGTQIHAFPKASTILFQFQGLIVKTE